jgi:NAD(P)-dependent dehydrogenase (short-subunit alcohol dehydrogenase family)
MVGRLDGKVAFIAGAARGQDEAMYRLFLASDEARYLTGVTLPVDAGITIK